MSEQEILNFAKKNGYVGIGKLNPWNGFDVYEPILSAEHVSYTGLPYVILVKGNKIRMSTDEESLKIIDESS